MNIWWLSDFNRLEMERGEIDKLEEQEEWLQGITWIFEKSTLFLCVEAEIIVNNVSYPIRMCYPDFFPASPPTVKPQNTEARWSGHQYGSGGDLCLEWGPDNWHQSVTGAEMLRSAHRLLSSENPLDEQQHQVEVQSRHLTTLGQDLRSMQCRFILTKEASEYLCALLKNKRNIEAIIQQVVMNWNNNIIYYLLRIETKDRLWTEKIIPKAMEHFGQTLRTWVVKGSESLKEQKFDSSSNLKNWLLKEGYDSTKLDEKNEMNKPRIDSILLMDDEGNIDLVWEAERKTEQPKRLRLGTILISDNDESLSRLGSLSEKLEGKKVGIVGVGSAGSKIALMLARSNVQKFLLVDDDIFLPENLVRHTLDWRNVGEHKVDGVALQINLVSANVSVETEKRRLVGQEPPSKVALILKKLARCDLIIDATACSHTFGLLATIAQKATKPLIWLEIFAGGIGGIVARFRPGSDPDPMTMRTQILNFFSNKKIPEVITAGSYTASEPSGKILVASDADVEVISSYAALMALDIMTDTEPSAFHYSVYIVGLVQYQGLFDQPLHTIPLELKNETMPKHPQASEEKWPPSQDTISFLRDLMEKNKVGRDNTST